MGSIADILRLCIEGVLTPFDYLGPFWGLTLLSLLSGVGMLWVVGKTTPQTLVEKSRAKMDSAVYEIRLFLDSPKRVFISLGRLIGHSLLYIAYMLPAFVILAVPLGLMYLSLETRHGMDALPLNTPFVVEVQLESGADGRKLSATHTEGLEITAAPLVVESEGRVYLRAEAKTKAAHSIYLAMNGQRAVEKKIITDPDALQMQPQRTKGLDRFYSYGPEDAPDAPIAAVSVTHPAKDGSYLGISMPWWLWWLLLMMISAFGLRKQLGVTL